MKFLRPLICGFIFLFGLSYSLCAQNQKGSQSISAGIGIVSPEMINDMTEDMIRGVAGVFGYDLIIVNRTYTPTFSLAYQRAFANRCILSGVGTYEKAAGDYQINNEIKGNFRRQTFTIATEGKILYLNDKGVSLYGTIGVGYSFNYHHINKPKEWVNITPRKNHLNGFFSPIGVCFGEKFGGFFEAGYGYKGILNTGISYRL